MFYTLAKSQIRTASHIDDFVEDSEPEREELRRKKAQPSKLQERNTKIFTSTNDETNTNVVEISGMIFDFLFYHNTYVII